MNSQLPEWTVLHTVRVVAGGWEGSWHRLPRGTRSEREIQIALRPWRLQPQPLVGARPVHTVGRMYVQAPVGNLEQPLPSGRMIDFTVLVPVCENESAAFLGGGRRGFYASDRGQKGNNFAA